MKVQEGLQTKLAFILYNSHSNRDPLNSPHSSSSFKVGCLKFLFKQTGLVLGCATCQHLSFAHSTPFRGHIPEPRLHIPTQEAFRASFRIQTINTQGGLQHLPEVQIVLNSSFTGDCISNTLCH